MTYFRRLKETSFIPWIFLLSFSLVCVQGTPLHIHEFSHFQEHEHVSIDMDDHIHLNIAHDAYDSSHYDHHDHNATEVDISFDGLIKNKSSQYGDMAVLLFVLVFTFYFGPFVFSCSRRQYRLILHENYVLSPPLRAPPAQ